MSKVKSMRIDDISYDIGADYSNIDNTPTFKTINGETITGTGNITIEGGSGTPTDVKINGSSITSSGTANIVTEGVYNPSTNKLATMSDMPDITGKQDTLVSGTNIKTINGQSILGEGNINIEGGSGGGSYMPSISDDALEFLAGSNARVEGEELIF